MKRILHVMAVVMLSCYAIADSWTDPETGIEWTYTVLNDDAYLDAPAISQQTSGAIAIPQKLDGHPVVSIGDNSFSSCKKITSIIIPEGVSSIGISAFYDCSSLVSVSMPTSLSSIGGNAFAACSKLMSATIPPNVNSIGSSAFYNCVRLMSASIPNGITIIPDYLFSECTGLTSVTIPPSVTTIRQGAFSGCIGLTSLTIPDGVINFGYGSFSSCGGLASVTFEGAPPADFRSACFNTDVLIRYNRTYETSWLSMLNTYPYYYNRVAYDPEPKPIEGLITFIATDGIISEESHAYTGDVYGVLPEARRAGHTFAGWYTTPDGNTRVTAFSSVDPSIKALYARWVEDDSALYAQWDANAYSVTFDANGGTGTMPNQPFLYDQIQPLYGSLFTKLGYTFKGWATNAYGEVVYADKESVSNLTAEAGFAIALFAKWDKIVDITVEEIEDWVVYTLAPKYKKLSESKADYRRRFEETFGNDYAAAFYKETGKIGMDGSKLRVWHDYVAGTDPLNITSQFEATITFDVQGIPQIDYQPKFDDPDEAAKRIYTRYGKRNLKDAAWSIINGDEADYNFFKVTVKMK